MKLNAGFISALAPASDCSPSMCSARVSKGEKMNRNGSQTRINILQCFFWYSSSCGRMLDNVMEMSAATTSPLLGDYVLPLQRPFRVSRYRWENANFHFNKIQILTWIMWHRKGREGHKNSSAILHTHPRAGKYYSLTTNRLRDMILLQIRLSVNDFSGVGKQKMCVNLILFEMFKFLKTPFCFLVCFFMCSLKY